MSNRTTALPKRKITEDITNAPAMDEQEVARINTEIKAVLDDIDSVDDALSESENATHLQQ